LARGTLGVQSTKTNLTLKKILTLLVLFSTILACVSEDNNRAKKVTSSSIEDSSKKEESMEKVKKIKRIFYSLPSPLELTLLFKKEGIVYYGEVLHDVDRRDDYVLTSAKALNLGVYGADLSYAGLFGKHQQAIEFFAVTKLLAEDLGIGETFQNRFISRLEENANNKDTLLQVISDFFLKNDAYLKDLNQQDISTHVLVGGWIEGIYLGISMAVEDVNRDGIKNIIIGQKYSLSNLITLLEDANDTRNQETAWLLSSVEELEVLFDQLESNTDSSGEKASTMPQDSLMLEIKNKVSEIRSKIIE
jgi:hypothetical protein